MCGASVSSRECASNFTYDKVTLMMHRPIPRCVPSSTLSASPMVLRLDQLVPAVGPSRQWLTLPEYLPAVGEDRVWSASLPGVCAAVDQSNGEIVGPTPSPMAVLTSNSIEKSEANISELQSTIERFTGSIAALSSSIKELEAELAADKKALAEAAALRNKQLDESDNLEKADIRNVEKMAPIAEEEDAFLDDDFLEELCRRNMELTVDDAEAEEDDDSEGDIAHDDFLAYYPFISREVQPRSRAYDIQASHTISSGALSATPSSVSAADMDEYGGVSGGVVISVGQFRGWTFRKSFLESDYIDGAFRRSCQPELLPDLEFLAQYAWARRQL